MTLATHAAEEQLQRTTTPQQFNRWSNFTTREPADCLTLLRDNRQRARPYYRITIERTLREMNSKLEFLYLDKFIRIEIWVKSGDLIGF